MENLLGIFHFKSNVLLMPFTFSEKLKLCHAGLGNGGSEKLIIELSGKTIFNCGPKNYNMNEITKSLGEN
jgi:hypothetical protein